jgi:DNA invertase Pin-like site-specific DNA recombinase
MNEPVPPPDGPAPGQARQAIRARAESLGWGIVDDAWLSEAGLSDTARIRPGTEGAIEAVRRRKARALVVAKQDRRDRALRDVARLMDTVTRQYWALVALEADVRTQHGRVVLATFAPYERRLLGERTRAALAARKAAGFHVGRKPAVPQEIVERIVAERQAGASLHAIARGLNAEGVRSSAGGRWYASTVRYVLMSAGGRPSPAVL